MKLFFKRTKWYLVALSIIALCFVLLSIIKIDKDITTPSGITKVEDIIQIKNDDGTIINNELNIDINTVSVFSYSRVSILNYLIGKLNVYAKIIDLPKTLITSNSYIIAQGNLDKKISIYNAIISGYEAAGYNIGKNFSGYIVTSITNFCVSDFEIGDILLTIDKYTISKDLSPNDAFKLCYEVDKSQTEFPCTVNRNGKEVNLTMKLVPYNDTLKVGVTFESYYQPFVDDTHKAPTFSYTMGDSIGPSGGLMQSLYVYELLTGGKLTKDIKIAGTGTVDIYGNAGLIGGIEQKIITAELSNVDIFFVPVDTGYVDEEVQYSNWNDAYEAYQKLKNPHLKIVPVKNLQEILDYLEDYSK